MKEEIAELKEVIDRKSKALIVAEEQKEELDFSNRMVSHRFVMTLMHFSISCGVYTGFYLYCRVL